MAKPGAVMKFPQYSNRHNKNRYMHLILSTYALFLGKPMPMRSCLESMFLVMV